MCQKIENFELSNIICKDFHFEIHNATHIHNQRIRLVLSEAPAESVLVLLPDKNENERRKGQKRCGPTSN